MNVPKGRRIHLSKKTIIASIVLLAAASVAIVYAMSLFTHNFPAVTVSPAAVVTTACGTSAASPLKAQPNTVTAGNTQPYWILFTCPDGSGPVHVSNSGAATPTGPAVNPGYHTLGLITHGTACSAAVNFIGLVSGTPLAFGTAAGSIAPIGSDIDYCVDTTTGLGTTDLQAFTVAWTQ